MVFLYFHFASYLGRCLTSAELQTLPPLAGGSGAKLRQTDAVTIDIAKAVCCALSPKR